MAELVVKPIDLSKVGKPRMSINDECALEDMDRADRARQIMKLVSEIGPSDAMTLAKLPDKLRVRLLIDGKSLP